MYIYIYILSSSRKPSGRFFFMASVVDIIKHLLMVSVVVFFVIVSVVAGNVFSMVSVVVFFMVSAVVGKPFSLSPLLPQQAAAAARSG